MLLVLFFSGFVACLMSAVPLGTAWNTRRGLLKQVLYVLTIF
jgi:hypothetical protein